MNGSLAGTRRGDQGAGISGTFRGKGAGEKKKEAGRHVRCTKKGRDSWLEQGNEFKRRNRTCNF